MAKETIDTGRNKVDVDLEKYTDLVLKLDEAQDKIREMEKITKELKIATKSAQPTEKFSFGALFRDENDINEYNEEQLEIQKNMTTICNVLGCKLTKYDEQKIIHFYDTLNHEEMIQQRYNSPSIVKNHPTYKEIIKKFPLKKAKAKRDKSLKAFKDYLITCNQLFVNIFLILFYLQTSIPPYPVKSKQSM